MTGVGVGVGAGVAGVGDSVGDGDSTGEAEGSTGDADGSGDGESTIATSLALGDGSAPTPEDVRLPSQPTASTSAAAISPAPMRPGRDERRATRSAVLAPGGGRYQSRQTTPRRSDRSCSWAPSRGLQLRSGAADGRAEGTGRRPEDGSRFVVGAPWTAVITRAVRSSGERSSMAARTSSQRTWAVGSPSGPLPSGVPMTQPAQAPEPVRREPAGRHEEPRQDRSLQSSWLRWSQSRRNASWARSSNKTNGTSKSYIAIIYYIIYYKID